MKWILLSIWMNGWGFWDVDQIATFPSETQCEDVKKKIEAEHPHRAFYCQQEKPTE